ncbi:MAG: LuxR C-terminal-related transcriptional regulator [Christensenellaceae bacterium]|nr:LuxR C-terminal-related transcriptional regulator [Christensenellaceae bacterium]MEA5069835.1 LuxR C-terminal-related transcriptional regulator [Christensenellaceae bacterium]
MTKPRQHKTLRRDRVNRALERIFDHPMTVVEAPIGYGKTTAVRDFLALRGTPVVWTSFYPEDDTAQSFWARFAAEIGKLDEAAGRRLRCLGVPSDAPQTTAMIAIIDGIDWKPDTAIVVDDFHLARDMKLTMLFRRFVTELPGNLHIVLLTRDTSNLDVAELAAKGLCSILPQRTLRFTDGELRAYCALMGFRPGEEALKRVATYTDGWISLAYLILLGIEQGIPVGGGSAIDELVEQVLYKAYDEPIRRFLRRVSVMDAFTADQARFVTGEACAGDILRRLRRENAFISYDEPADLYRIHNVLLDFLRLRQDDAERAPLYRRVGEWHLQQGAVKSACACLCRAGEVKRVLSLLDDEDAITNDSAEFDGALDMFAAAPRTLLLKYPLACLQYVVMLLLSGGSEAPGHAVALLDALQAHYECAADIDSSRRSRVLSEISTARVFVVFNDAHKMVACTNEALRLLGGGSSRLIRREGEFTFGCPHFLYTYYREPGRLRETASYMAAEFPAFSRLANGCGTGCDYVTLAEYALETGDWPAAELNAFKAIYKAHSMGQTGIILCAGLTLARLYIHQGRIGEALGHLHRLRADVEQENRAVYNTTLDLIDGYVHACLMRPDGIPEWLRTGDMSPARFMYQGMAFNYIVYGKAVLLAKDFLRLEILTETLPQHFGILRNQLGLMHNQILGAAAKYRLYGMEVGSAALRAALDIGRADRLILPFAEYAPAILDMMRRVACDAYTQAVLAACEQYANSLSRAPQAATLPTPRELEVLRLTAEGLRRDEVAARMFVSPGTVKAHLENIYRKLGVSGKTAALKKAQMLKIL